MSDSGHQVPERLYRRVADRLVAYDSRLAPSEADGLMWIIELAEPDPAVVRRAEELIGEARIAERRRRTPRRG